MRTNGFSLLELLMASLIVAAAGVLLFGGLAHIMRSRALAQEQTIMRALLANRLALLETVAESEQADGSCEAPYGTYRWAVSAAPTAVGALPSLATVTISVTSPTGYTIEAITIRPIRHE